MNRKLVLIAVLYFISFNVFPVERDKDELGIYLVFNYKFDSGTTGQANFGMSFRTENQEVIFQKHNFREKNGTNFSCVECTDEEFRKAAAMYGLILLVGYGLANELIEKK